jgi:nucleotide-binding universal stress UspA family protein
VGDPEGRTDMTEQAEAHRIVVGIDGSERSVGALRWALAQARLTGAKVEALMCWEVPGSIYITPTHTEAYYEQRAEEAFAAVLEQVRADTEGVSLEARLVGLPAPRVLMEAAVGADLLVVGSHSTLDRHGVHLGSVSSYCAHHAPCPVLVHRT